MGINKIILSIGSITYATKAKKLLLKRGVLAEVVKTDFYKKSEGCSFGIVIAYRNFYEAVGILRENNISYTVYKN